MKLVKIAEYDNESERLTYHEAVKAAKAKGCRLLTVEEWIDSGIKPGHPLYCCVPSWLKKTKGGLLVAWSSLSCLTPRGFSFDRRFVYADYQPSSRFGVVGTSIIKKED